MSRMNYNRPNGGYESESWRRSLPSGRVAERNTSTKQKLKEHAMHQSDVRPHNHGYSLWCVECNCNIKYLTRDEIQAWREIQKVKK